MDKLEYVVQVKEIIVKINPGLAVGNAGLRNKELSKRAMDFVVSQGFRSR